MKNLTIKWNGEKREENVGRDLRSDYREFCDYGVSIEGVEVALIIRQAAGWTLRPVVFDLQTRKPIAIETGSQPLARDWKLGELKKKARYYFEEYR